MKARKNLFFVAVLVLSVLCGSARAIDGLIAHWKFDEGTGSIAYDSAGNNDGTLYGATWTTGQVGEALSFDGDSDYVSVPHSAVLNITGDITIAAWVYFTKGVTYQAIVTKCVGNGPRNNPFDFRASNLHLTLVRADASGHERVYSTINIPIGEWHHVLVRVENKVPDFYVNGVVTGKSVDTTFTRTPTGNINPLLIGRRDDGLYFNGVIDEVMIFNRALSAEEVQELYLSISTPVAIDIKPGSCPNPLNLKSQGLLPVAVLGSEDFDVNTIDPVSLRLAGVAPIRSSYEDVATPVSDGNECECTEEGPDGYTDLTLKFRTREIVEQLIDTPGGLVKGQTLGLNLSGALFDDRAIAGSDCVVLVGNVSRWLSAKRWDGNEDGIINMRDLAELATYWLESAIVQY